jgi:NAD(P)-dependent dehydrogenase (short-subunit alcohol dehydrogenase family)
MLNLPTSPPDISPDESSDESRPRPPLTALITGAGRRIGAAVARYLVGRGAKVVLHYRASAPEAQALAADLGPAVHLLQADLGDPAQVDGLLPRAAACFGPVSLLVNNASSFLKDDLTSLTWQSWQQNMQINAAAPLFLARAFAAQAPAGGVIVNMLDQKLHRPTPDFLSYTIGKMALQGATLLLAQALAEQRVRVAGIAPGMTLISGKQTAERFAAARAAAPLGTSSTPEELAAAIGFIWDSPSLTGTILTLDGGESLPIGRRPF